MECLFTILMYGDCTSYNGRIWRMLDYRGVGLVRFHCTELSGIITMPLTLFTHRICYINDIRQCFQLKTRLN